MDMTKGEIEMGALMMTRTTPLLARCTTLTGRGSKLASRPDPWGPKRFDINGRSDVVPRYSPAVKRYKPRATYSSRPSNSGDGGGFILAISEDDDAPDPIPVRQPSPTTSEPTPSPIPSQRRRKLPRYSYRPCHLLIFLRLLTIVGSLVPALWRVITRDDISGAFSLAQYILAVGIFVVGSMVAILSRKCDCWR